MSQHFSTLPLKRRVRYFHVNVTCGRFHIGSTLIPMTNHNLASFIICTTTLAATDAPCDVAASDNEIVTDIEDTLLEADDSIDDSTEVIAMELPKTMSQLIFQTMSQISSCERHHK
jgi:hypothetical protein